MDWEFAFLDWIQAHLQCRLLDTVMPFVTSLGYKGIFWIVLTLLGLAYKPTRKYAHVAAIALLLCLICGNVILKPLLARVRPYDINTAVTLLIKAPTDYSFPSGHTQSGFAVAAAVFMWKKRWGIPALILAALIAFSRMYLYVHYPTDVLGGFLFGIGFAMIGLFICDRLFRGKKDWDGCAPRTAAPARQEVG